MDETLVIIPNVGVDAGLQAGEGEMGLYVTWLMIELKSVRGYKPLLHGY